MEFSLIEMQDRLYRATEGPWKYIGQELHVGQGPGAYTVRVTKEGDGEFIAHARTDFERLVDEVARLRLGLGAVRDGLRAVHPHTSGLARESIEALIDMVKPYFRES